MLLSSTLLLAGLAARSVATTIPVSVGKNGLTFEPNVIHAHQGDVIEFRFWPRNHSVVAGTFDSACHPASEGGFYSGFFSTQQGTVNPQVFRVTVSHTNPVPIYCSQNNSQHCKNGMVAVINPAGSGALTLDTYAALARQAGDVTSPSGGAFGGQVAPNEAASSSSSRTATGGTVATTVTETGSESETSSSSTETGTQTETEVTSTTSTTTVEATTTTTGAGTETATAMTTTTGTPTSTSSAAAGVAAPVAGLVMAVAVGAFFV
ncbi:uncharacterized protein B0T15DRAFT_530029 [Chaetomium strumarium]|uniref:Extracellular serine-rich protein n=1 Tax=Chaetomium strumarium TaxID=1170767 RepID=A0AAJ0M367_9PEZI|nr:hypothetical protein B0T15DRAFT_530029 [Chaetomium strumarium]